MLAPQIESYIASQLTPVLPSCINHSVQTFDNINAISNYLHNAIGVLAGNLPMPGLEIDNNYRSASTAVLSIEKQGFKDYCQFLAEEIRNRHSELKAIESSNIFLLENIHSGWNVSIQYESELQLLINYDGILMSKIVDTYIGNMIRSFMGTHYRITDARPFITSLGINEGKNYNNKPHTDGGAPFTTKIIIYLSDVDIDNGPFCIVENGVIKPILGKAGTIIIFENLKVEHCSLPIKKGARAALSLEMIPALTPEIVPCYNRPLNGIQLLNPFVSNPFLG